MYWDFSDQKRVEYGGENECEDVLNYVDVSQKERFSKMAWNILGPQEYSIKNIFVVIYKAVP